MSTSEYGGIVEYDPSELASNEPADTALVRRVINNANHYADQAGQVVCNWVAVNPALAPWARQTLVGLVYPPLEMAAGATTTTWFRFGLVPQWDAKVRSDGSGYRLRVRARVAVDPSIGAPCDIAVVVGPEGITESDIGADFVATKYAMGFTGTSPQDLTFDDGTRHIDVPGMVIGAARDDGALQPTRMDIGGPETTVTTARMVVMLCGRGVALDGQGLIENAPVLYGLHVAEYMAA